jgi:hypothetical protein
MPTRRHQVIKRALAKVEPKPDRYGIYEPQSAVSDQEKIGLSSRPKRSEVEGPAVPQLSPEITAGEDPEWSSTFRYRGRQVEVESAWAMPAARG